MSAAAAGQVPCHVANSTLRAFTHWPGRNATPSTRSHFPHVDNRPRCVGCGTPVRNMSGDPYSVGDDVDHDGICQWCRDDLHADLAVDWLMAVREYGIAKANEMFAEATP